MSAERKRFHLWNEEGNSFCGSHTLNMAVPVDGLSYVPDLCGACFLAVAS